MTFWKGGYGETKQWFQSKKGGEEWLQWDRGEFDWVMKVVYILIVQVVTQL